MRDWDQLSNLEQLAQIYSDCHKDAYGFRDREPHPEWTEADYERELAALQVIINREEEEERQLCLRKQREFEDELASFIRIGAGDRATALRWWFESNGAEPGWLANPRYHSQEIEHVAYGLLPIPLWRFILPEVIPNYTMY